MTIAGTSSFARGKAAAQGGASSPCAVMFLVTEHIAELTM
jgi:hypothetical protein